MHELTVAQEIIRIIQDEQTRQNFDKVDLIRLKAGCFSCIDPHALEFAFQVVREGSCAAKARIDMTLEPVRIECRACGCSAEVDNASSSCPKCGSSDIVLQGDSSFEIIALEVV